MKRGGIAPFCAALGALLVGSAAHAQKVNWQGPNSLNGTGIGDDIVTNDGRPYEIKVMVPENAGVVSLRVTDPAIQGLYENQLAINPSMGMCISFRGPDDQLLQTFLFTSNADACNWVNTLVTSPPAIGPNNSLGATTGCLTTDCCDEFRDPHYVEYLLNVGPSGSDPGVYTIAVDTSPNCMVSPMSRTLVTGYEFAGIQDPGGADIELDTYMEYTGVAFNGNTTGTAHPDVSGGENWYLYAFAPFFASLPDVNSDFQFSFTSPGDVLFNQIIPATAYDSDSGATTYRIDQYGLYQDPRNTDCAYGQIEQGMWQVDYSLRKPGGGLGFVVILCDDWTSGGPALPSNLLRGFQQPTVGTLGGRPYLRQLLDYVSGPNPRYNSDDTGDPTLFNLIIDVIVPFDYNGRIEFGNSNSGTCDGGAQGNYPAPQHDVTISEPGSSSNGNVVYDFDNVTFSPSGQYSILGAGSIRWIPGSQSGDMTGSLSTSEYSTMIIPVSVDTIATGVCLDITLPPGNSGALRAGWRNKAAQTGTDGCVAPNPSRDRDGSTETTDSGSTGTGEGELEGDPPTDASPTYASVTDVALIVSEARTFARWQTTTESGTAAFRLEHNPPGAQGWTPVGPWLPAQPDAPQGATYTTELPLAVTEGQSVELRVLEAETRGGHLHHGPFNIIATRGPTPAATGVRPSSMLVRAAPAGELDPTAPSVRPFQVMRPALRLETSSEGLYRLSSAEIATVFGVPQQTAAQWARDRELVLHHAPTFGQTSETQYFLLGDDVVFYADAPSRIESQNRVYLLRRQDEGLSQVPAPKELDATPAPGGAEIDQYTHEARYEQDVVAATAATTAPGDEFWMWDFLLAGNPTAGTKDYTFDVHDLRPGDAEMRVELRGGNDTTELVDHEVVVRLNGMEIGRAEFSGLNRAFVDVTLPSGSLLEGSNTLTVQAELIPGVPSSLVYVDEFRVRYPRTFQLTSSLPSLQGVAASPGTIVLDNYTDGMWLLDVTNPDAPARLLNPDVTGPTARLTSVAKRIAAVDPTQALAPVNVRLAQYHDVQEEVGGEYVVIAPQAWRDIAEAFASRHQDRGLTWTVVETERIADAYGFGYPSAQAIRRFLADAYSFWPNRPSMVLLLGDGSYDLRNIRGFGDAIVPSMLTATVQGLFASDTALGDVTGSDGIPEIAVGRVPALSRQEAEQYLAKVRAFESTLEDSWQESSLIVADNPDDGGEFTAVAWSLYAGLADFAGVDVLLLQDSDPDTLRQATIDRVSAGVRLVQYTGHAGITQLTQEGYFSVEDVPFLRNVGRPTILSASSCLLGRFELPGLTTLAEQLLLMPDVGTVATLAPMGLEYSERSKGVTRIFGEEVMARDAEYLATAYLRGISQRDNVLADRRDTRHQFNLLGDPALALTAPRIVTDVAEPTGGTGCQQSGGSSAWFALFALAFLLRGAIRPRRWR